MRWWLWGLLLLLLAGAVRALVASLPADEAVDVTALDAPPPAAPEAEDLPGLRGPPAAPAADDPTDLAEIPKDLVAPLHWAGDPKNARRALPWLLADPPEGWRPEFAWGVAHGAGVKFALELWMGLGKPPGLRHEPRELLAHVATLLEDPSLPARLQCVLLGFLERFPSERATVRTLLRAVAGDRARHPACRAYAARALLDPSFGGVHGKTPATHLSPEDVAVVRGLFAEDVPAFWQQEVSLAIQGLDGHGEALTALFTDALPGGTSPGPMIAFLAARVKTTEGRARTRLEELLFGNNDEEVLALLQHAPDHARIVGVRRLFLRGMDAQRLRPHLLAVLPSEDATAAALAVDAIPLLGMPDRDVLEVVEAMLAGDDPARHLVAVKALGALGRLEGEHTDALRRLGAFAREARSARMRIQVIPSILIHGRQSALAAEALAGMLADGEAEVRREAVDALGHLAFQHPEARAALEGARGDTDEDVRQLVVYWLDRKDTDDD